MVTVEGVACLLYSLSSTAMYLVVFFLLMRFFGEKRDLNKHVMFMDMFFMQSSSMIVKALVIKSGYGFDETNDLVEAVGIFMMIYLCFFRMPHWRLL